MASRSGWSTHHPAQALGTEGRQKEHVLSQKVGLEQVKDSELHLPAEGRERTKGEEENEV